MLQGLLSVLRASRLHLSCACLAQALFGELPEDIKIAAELKGHVALLKLAGAEPALQLAQLVALEHLLGVTLPERTKEVRAHKSAAAQMHLCVTVGSLVCGLLRSGLACVWGTWQRAAASESCCAGRAGAPGAV